MPPRRFLPSMRRSRAEASGFVVRRLGGGWAGRGGSGWKQGRNVMSIGRPVFVAALAPAAIRLLPRRALAAYPERPIDLILLFAAGGNADGVGRITGDLINKALGRPVVVENR